MRERRYSEDNLAGIRIMRKNGARLKEIQSIYGGALSTLSTALHSTPKPPSLARQILAALERIERKLEKEKA